MYCRNARVVSWSFVGMLPVLLVGVTPCLYGQILIDDFDHMDPTLPGWTLADLSAGQLWGPGEYDPSSGALRIYHSGSEFVPPGTPFTTTAMFALRNETTDPLFSNGFVRAKIRTDEAQNSTSTFIRADLATATAYDLFGFTKPPNSLSTIDGQFALSKFVGGVEETVWRSGIDSGIEYRTGEDWNVELGAVGDQISAKVWKVNDLEPMTPQFMMIDDNPIMSGMLAISSDKSLGNTIPARGDATFDDIYFTPVEFAPITVEIKPGSDVAPINLKSKGKLPVAILSTEGFDATHVDPSTLLFGDPSLINAGAAPVSPLRSGQEDVNNDGLFDLTLKFSTQELIAKGVLGRLTTQGYLTGNLLDGTVIAGRDLVRIVPRLKSIPEPTSLLLVFGGMLALTIRRGRNRRHTCRRRS